MIEKGSKTVVQKLKNNKIKNLKFSKIVRNDGLIKNNKKTFLKL